MIHFNPHLSNFKLKIRILNFFEKGSLMFGSSRNGAVLLPMVLMISAVVIMIGMAGLVVGVAFNRSNASMRASNMALEAARAGIADVQRRILRDSQWMPICASLAIPSYTLTVSTAAKEAIVDLCVNKVGNEYTVQAQGKARLRKKQLNAVISIDPATNQMRVQSINEVQF